VADRLLGQRLRAPVDCGRRMADGQRVFGSSKTWRGLAAAVVAAAAVAPLLGLSPALGAAAGLFAMVGDLLSSFAKRRMGLGSSAMALGIDQIPESLLPAAVLAPAVGLGVTEVLLLTALFFAIELVLSALLYLVGLRDQPY
jgi:CDP-2,3-bis-(O-geranylgeranyl)-sn-glycerol synthase